MTCWIEKDGDGRDCIYCNSAEVGADVRTQALHADTLFIRASDGQFFTGPQDLVGMSRLAPHDVEMAKHLMAERGMPAPNIFSGESDG